MIAYGLRTLYVNSVYNMKNNRGKILQCGLGYNGGFATVFVFKNFDYEYYFLVKEGDKIEIPKGVIEVQRNEYKGNINDKITIKTDLIVHIDFEKEEKEGKKEIKDEIEENLNENDNEPRFDDALFNGEDKKEEVVEDKIESWEDDL